MRGVLVLGSVLFLVVMFFNKDLIIIIMKIIHIVTNESLKASYAGN